MRADKWRAFHDALPLHRAPASTLAIHIMQFLRSLLAPDHQNQESHDLAEPAQVDAVLHILWRLASLVPAHGEKEQEARKTKKGLKRKGLNQDAEGKQLPVMKRRSPPSVMASEFEMRFAAVDTWVPTEFVAAVLSSRPFRDRSMTEKEEQDADEENGFEGFELSPKKHWVKRLPRKRMPMAQHPLSKQLIPQGLMGGALFLNASCQPHSVTPAPLGWPSPRIWNLERSLQSDFFSLLPREGTFRIEGCWRSQCVEKEVEVCWSPSEIAAFVDKLVSSPNLLFRKIAHALNNSKSHQDCVQFYYLMRYPLKLGERFKPGTHDDIRDPDFSWNLEDSHLSMAARRTLVRDLIDKWLATAVVPPENPVPIWGKTSIPWEVIGFHPRWMVRATPATPTKRQPECGLAQAAFLPAQTELVVTSGDGIFQLSDKPIGPAEAEVIRDLAKVTRLPRRESDQQLELQSRVLAALLTGNPETASLVREEVMKSRNIREQLE